MAFQFTVAGVGVISHFVRSQDVSAIVNFTLTTKVIDDPNLLLLHGANSDIFLPLGGGRRGRSRRAGIRGQRLAGYYPGREKKMTDKGGRDKDSRAGDH